MLSVMVTQFHTIEGNLTTEGNSATGTSNIGLLSHQHIRRRQYLAMAATLTPVETTILHGGQCRAST